MAKGSKGKIAACHASGSFLVAGARLIRVACAACESYDSAENLTPLSRELACQAEPASSSSDKVQIATASHAQGCAGAPGRIFLDTR